MAAHKRARLELEPRESAGSRSAMRALRAGGKVTASIFGHGENQALQVDSRELEQFLRFHNIGSVIDAVIDGKVQPAVIREVERHITRGDVLQFGLQRISMRETLKVTVPVVVHGEADLIDRDLVLERQISDLEVHGRAGNLPEHLEVDVTGMHAGESIRVRDVVLPAGVETGRDPDLPVVSVTHPRAVEEEEPAPDTDEVPLVGEEQRGDEAGGDATE